MQPGTTQSKGATTDESENSADSASSDHDRSASEQSSGELSEAASAATDQGSETPSESTLCPVITAVDQIGSRWRLRVLHELETGECRFNELKRQTDANARTLSRVLDELQDDHLVTRRLEEDAPVATYYGLTEKGEALCPVFDELREWGEEWVLPEMEIDG